MKKLLLLLILCLSTNFVSRSQSQPSACIYWVVETNVYDSNYSIVKFYDSSHRLVQEKKLKGICIDITNPTHKKYLNLILRDFKQRKLFFNTKKLNRIKSESAKAKI